MTTRRLMLACALAASLGAGTACRQDMHDAPRYDALEKSDFFPDRRTARPLIEGTVARGQLRADDAYYTGKALGQPISALPAGLTLDKALIERGQSRFNIYCAPCHSQTGEGDGMVVRRGYKQPPSIHDARLRAQPIGYFYDVMTRGFGQMPDYAAQIQPRDRWAVAVYLRALQLSQHATVEDVPAEERGNLDKPTESAPQHGQPGEKPAAGQKEGSAAHE
jgi:mono/diheme cytochrome c family protein